MCNGDQKKSERCIRLYGECRRAGDRIGCGEGSPFDWAVLTMVAACQEEIGELRNEVAALKGQLSKKA
jgi:uncharacterized small protein (DUF1192 family)